MLRYTTFLIMVLISIGIKAQDILPSPEKVQMTEGKFSFGNQVSISLDGIGEATFNYLASVFPDMHLKKSGQGKRAQLALSQVSEKHLGNEGYRLNVSKQQISISAN